MIEQIILDYFESIQDFPVTPYVMRPENAPTSYIIIERTGGSSTNKIKSATIAIQSYAPTLLDAATLNEAVKEAMEDIITLDSISSCRLQNDYNFTNTATKQPRYQAVFNLTYY